MQLTKQYRRLIVNDVRLIGRDSFMLFMLAFAVVIAVFVRFALPALNNTLIERSVLNETTFISSLTDLYPMLIAYLVWFSGALLVGTIFGFMLLDEKEDNTIKAMMVTPMSLDDYLIYRVGVPVIVTFFVVLFQFWFIDLEQIPAWQAVMLAGGASLTAPIITLFYASFAANKVEGFAYAKFIGVGGWTILGGWFVAMPFQLLLSIFPPFWIAKTYWMMLAGESLWWLALLIGVLTQLGTIGLLMRRFNHIAHQ